MKKHVRCVGRVPEERGRRTLTRLAGRDKMQVAGCRGCKCERGRPTVLSKLEDEEGGIRFCAGGEQAQDVRVRKPRQRQGLVVDRPQPDWVGCTLEALEGDRGIGAEPVVAGCGSEHRSLASSFLDEI